MIPNINLTIENKGDNGASNSSPDRGSILWHNTGTSYGARFAYDGNIGGFIMATSGTNTDYTLLGKTHEFLNTGAANKSDGTTTWGTISD